METTRLSSKGQVIIPKGFRASHHWLTGLELQVIEAGDGVLLKPRTPFPETTIDQVAGMLKREGQKAFTDSEIKEGLKKSIRRKWHARG